MQVADKLNKDENYLKITKGLSAVVEFALQDKKIIAEIKNGKILVNSVGVTPTVFLEFTKVIAKGNLSKLLPYTEAFLKIGEEIRKS